MKGGKEEVRGNEIVKRWVSNKKQDRDQELMCE
jgi:hypothetical protein